VSVNILHGDCRTVLPTLADGSVQCCVTSPPYYGLRSYLPDGHPDKHKEIGLEQAPCCNRHGLFRLRAGLTEDQKRFVVQRLLDGARRDV